MVAAWEWGLLFILILISAFFSGSETALMSLSRLRARHLVELGIPGATLVYKLLECPNKLLSTILVGNNIVNIGASALATSVALRLFGQSGVGIAVGVMTVLMLIFGEVTPKTYAAINGEKLALQVSRPISWLEVLFYPIIKILGAIANFLIRLLGGKVHPDQIFITEKEIRTLINLGEDQGTIEHQEQEIIDNVFELNDTLVREVMMPRVDVVALPVETNLIKAWEIVVNSSHSRLPVYQNNLDNVVGVLYAKDLMKYCQQLENNTVRNVMRLPYFVPGSKLISDLLREFRRERIHIAIVLDEFGGTAGVAFLEDLMETIIGEIRDEYDEFEPLIKMVGPGEVTVSPRVAVEEINKLLGLNLPKEDYDTIGGLIFHLFGRVPAKDETMEYSNAVFTVYEVENNRIKKIRIANKP
ncbi:MAG: hemolysin family protein [Bacillota bacterium]|nr:hemolysin family protein [Bacillota bacterium]